MEVCDMNCPSCNNELPNGSLFCEFCGQQLRPNSPANSAGTPVAQANPQASAAAIAELSGALIKSLSLGEKLSGVGSLAATIGFFLPWVSVPDLRSLGNLSTLLGGTGLAAASYSGFDAGRVWGAYYLILAAAVTSGVLFFVAGKATYSKKLMASGFQVMIGSMLGPGVVFTLILVPLIQSVAGIGLWLTGLGFCSILAGGLVTIGQLGKMTR
jgi:hypothetical protein